VRIVTGWLGIACVMAGFTFLATLHFLAGWCFLFFGLLYCISGVGPLVDRWDATRRRK
jgi:hypothetical protein